MPAGDGFSARQRYEIDRAIRDAETVCRLEFAVYVGPADGDPRSFAERVHSNLKTPGRCVMVVVDPDARALEIVTGTEARRYLEDSAVRLATITMQSSFLTGDLVGGIKRGLAAMAEAARRPQTLHA